MNPFYFMASLLTVIAICPAQAAMTGESVPIVEVFTTWDQKDRSESHAEFLIPDQGINLQVSLAKYYSNGNGQLEQTAAMLFPGVAV
jgi:hypothetical protein